MKAIGFCLDDEDALDFIKKYLNQILAPCASLFFGGPFHIKHPKHAGALSSVKVNKARPMSEVEARKKENLKISHDEDTRRDKENRNRTQIRNAGL